MSDSDNDESDVQYETLSDGAHIILRPDAYVGSTASEFSTVWVLDEPSWPPASSPSSVKKVEGKEDEDEDKENENEPPTPKTPSTPAPETPTTPQTPTKKKAKKKASSESGDDAMENEDGMPPPEPKSRPEIKRVAKFVQRTFENVPALLKIIDEILVNAGDARERSKLCTKVRVTINEETGEISVWNNGPGIATEKHKSGMWNAELIFGQMRSSSSFKDEKKRTWGGRNGFGAKLTNAFSLRFRVDTYDAKRGLSYSQTWRDNWSVREEAIVSPATKKESFVKVTFLPDYKRLSMPNGLDKDTLALLKRRVFDIAGTCPGLKVYLNGHRIAIKSFKDYTACFELADDAIRVYDNANPRWQFCVSTTSGDGMENMSFVNGVHTSDGGSHVQYVLDQIVGPIQESVHAKLKQSGAKVTPAMVRARLFVFVNSRIVNPAFSSQSKTLLVTKKADFGSTCEVSAKLIKKLTSRSAGLVEALVEDAELKSSKKLKDSDGKKNGHVKFDKLDDAVKAGGRDSAHCTLVLTEGDSAKGMVMGGLSADARIHFGVFPLKGKPINVREASITQLDKNDEFKAIKKIMGLKQNEVYHNVDALRYGHIMIASDQDTDGSHIKGLVCNMFAKFWPSLLQLPGFISFFRTPVVKATRRREVKFFFNEPDYHKWKEANDNGKGWTIKYYKGLGTSSKEEAKEYFNNIDDHRIEFHSASTEDFKTMQMAFDPKLAASRKTWIAGHRAGMGGVDHSNLTAISYTDFVNKELRLFALAANARAIPSMVDGLKPGQRKIIWSAFKRNLSREIKVAAFGGYVTESAAYHHGEASLQGTIIKLAQDFVGANNLPLLKGVGMFGTRAELGKNAASARYIGTHLFPITRQIYPASDDTILHYLDDDGAPIEPAHYLPVIPMVLVNGTAGLGYGWSTNVPAFNPVDLAANIRALLKNEPLKPMTPWVRGFRGIIRPNPKRQSDYVAEGVIIKIDSTTLRIQELSLDKSITRYKGFLTKLREAGRIVSISDRTADEAIHFDITMDAKQMAAAEKEGYIPYFKLQSRINTTNMVLFNADGQLKRYDSIEQIMKEFFEYRLPRFDDRKAAVIARIRDELQSLDNRARFITEVVEDRLQVRNVKKLDLLMNLWKEKYDMRTKEKTIVKEEKVDEKDGDENEQEKEEEEDAKAVDVRAQPTAKQMQSGYSYLIDMPLVSLTLEKVEAIRAQQEAKKAELAGLMGLSAREMWLRDLDVFDAALTEHERVRNAIADLSRSKADKAARKSGTKAGARRTIAKRRATEKEEDTEPEETERKVPPLSLKEGKSKKIKTVAASGGDEDEDDPGKRRKKKSDPPSSEKKKKATKRSKSTSEEEKAAPTKRAKAEAKKAEAKKVEAKKATPETKVKSKGKRARDEEEEDDVESKRSVKKSKPLDASAKSKRAEDGPSAKKNTKEETKSSSAPKIASPEPAAVKTSKKRGVPSSPGSEDDEDDRPLTKRRSLEPKVEEE